MEDGVDGRLRQQLPDDRGVAVAAPDQADATREGVAVALRKIIEDKDVVAGVDERLDRDRADIPGPAGDKNAHIRISR
jgi:hypothetical protein